MTEPRAPKVTLGHVANPVWWGLQVSQGLVAKVHLAHPGLQGRWVHQGCKVELAKRGTPAHPGLTAQVLLVTEAAPDFLELPVSRGLRAHSDRPDETASQGFQVPKVRWG